MYIYAYMYSVLRKIQKCFNFVQLINIFNLLVK